MVKTAARKARDKAAKMCGSKRPYDWESTAIRVMRRTVVKGKQPASWPMCVYRCWVCLKFHVGHQLREDIDYRDRYAP